MPDFKRLYLSRLASRSAISLSISVRIVAIAVCSSLSLGMDIVNDYTLKSNIVDDL